MSELNKICRALVQAKEYKADNTRKKKLYVKTLNVEKRLFDVYLKTGKSKKENFPFESIGKIIFMKPEETQKISKALFMAGWKPEVHVILTRKRFENLTFIGSTITY